MWGAITKNAHALAAIAAEQAQKGIASANELLEKLDGQLDGDGEEEDGEVDEEEDNDNNSNENGPRKVVKENERQEELLTPSKDQKLSTQKNAVVIGVDVDIERYENKEEKEEKEETWFTPMKEEPGMRVMHFDMKDRDTIDEADSAVVDEIDNLLLKSDEVEYPDHNDATIAPVVPNNPVILIVPSSKENEQVPRNIAMNVPQKAPSNLTESPSDSYVQLAREREEDARSQCREMESKLAFSKAENDALQFEIGRLSIAISTATESCAEAKNETDAANEAVKMMKLSAENDFKTREMRYEKELKRVAKEAEREVKAAQVEVLNLQVAAEVEIAAKLQRQESTLSEVFKARIEELENTARSLELAASEAKNLLELSQIDSAEHSRRESDARQQISELKERCEQDKLALERSSIELNAEKVSHTIAIQQLQLTLEKQEEKSKNQMESLSQEFSDMSNGEEEMKFKCKNLVSEVESLQLLLREMDAKGTIEKKDLKSEKEEREMQGKQGKEENDEMLRKYEALLSEKISIEDNYNTLIIEWRERDERDNEENEHRTAFVAANTILFDEKECEVISLKKELAGSVSRCEGQEAEVLALKKELNDSISRCDLLQIEINDVFRDFNASQEECAQLKKEFNESVIRCDVLSNEINDLTARTLESERKYEESLELSVLNRDITEDVQNIKDERNEENEVRRNEECNSALQEKDQQLQEKDQQLQEKDQQLQEKTRQLLEKIEELQEKGERLQEKTLQLQDNEDIKCERDASLTRCVALEDQIDSLRYEMDMNGNNDEIDALKQRLIEMENELDIAINERNGSEESLRVLSLEFEGLKSADDQNKGGEDEGNNLLENQSIGLKTKIVELQGEITSNNTLIRTLQEELEASRVNRENLLREAVEEHSAPMAKALEEHYAHAVEYAASATEASAAADLDLGNVLGELAAAQARNGSEGRFEPECARCAARSRGELEASGEVGALQGELTVAAEKAAGLRELVIGLKGEVSGLEGVLNAAREEAGVLRDELCAVEFEKELLMSSGKTLRLEYVALEEELEAARSVASASEFTLRSAVVVAEAATQAAVEALAVAVSEADLKVEEREAEERGKRELRVSETDSVAALMERVAAAERESKERERELEGQAAEIKERGAEIIKMEVDLKERESEIIRLRERVVEVEETRDTMKRERDDAEEQLISIEKLLKSGERTNNESIQQLVNSVQEYTEKIETKNTEINTLRSDLENVTREKMKFENDYEDHLSSKVILLSELESIKDSYNSLKVEKNLNEDKLKYCEKEIGEYEDKLSEVKEELQRNMMKMREMEDSMQEKVVENVTLREELRTANVRFSELENTHLLYEENERKVRSELSQCLAENEQIVSDNKNEKNILIEEIEYYKNKISSSAAIIGQLESQIIGMKQDLFDCKSRESDYVGRLLLAETTGMKVAEAEEALSRVEDKKKKDLINLKKQNERISSIQREMAEGERIAQDTISELRGHLEHSQSTVHALESTLESMKNDFHLISEKNRQLEGLLGPDGTFLGVKSPKGDESGSESSDNTAISSFVVVGESGGGRESQGVNRGDRGDGGDRVVVSTEDSLDRERERDDRRGGLDSTSGSSSDPLDSKSSSGSDPLLSAQASLVFELQDRYKEAVEEIRVLREQLSEQIQISKISSANTDTNTTEKAEKSLVKPKDENDENDEKTKLRGDLKYITGLYERCASRVTALEEERSRLESEAKEMERDMARAIHSPANAVYRQRPDKTMVDVEGGQGQLIRRDGEEEEDKKGEAGYHPIVAQIWSVVRSVCPSALQCIGDKPPRLGILGQGILVYFMGLHILVWWFGTYKCPVI